MEQSRSNRAVAAPGRVLLHTQPLRQLLAFAAVFGGACTFYTGQPQASQSPSNTAGAGASGGADSNPSGGLSGESGAGGEQSIMPVWVDATGSLSGRSNSAGGVFFLSTKPDENLLIVGLSQDGLWASSDGGKTFKGMGQTGASDQIINLPTGMVYDPVHSHVFWETGIYIGGGVYRSDDDGKTMTALGTATHTEFLSVDFGDPKRKTLLAGGHEQPQTLYISRNAGSDWTPIGDNIPMDTGFSSFPLILDAQTFLLGVTNKILLSTDGGDSWAIVSKSGGNGVPVVAADGTIYWRVEGDAGLMRSDDQGATWVRTIGAGIVTGELFELPDGRLASRTDKNVIVSADRGVTWTVVSAEFPFLPKTLVYSAQLKAFFISHDSPEPHIPDLSIMRYDWDFEAK